MKTCKKCGGTNIVGPKYHRHMSLEELRYACPCGYEWSEPTQDSKETKQNKDLLDHFFGFAEDYFKRADEMFDRLGKK